MEMRFCKERMSLTSRIKATKQVEKIILEHFHKEVPKYNIDVDLLPRINFHYYGRPGNCFFYITLSWLVWDFSLNWESNGLPPKRIRPKQSYRR